MEASELAAKLRVLILKLGFLLGVLVLVRDLWRLLVWPGKWMPWVLNDRFEGLAAKIVWPWGLDAVAILRVPLEWLKNRWLFLAIPLASIFVVAALYCFWNYVIVPLVHLLLRIITLIKSLFGGKVKRHIALCIDETLTYPEHTEKDFGATTNVYKFWFNLQGKRRKFLEWACGASRIKEWRSPDGRSRQIGLYYQGVSEVARRSEDIILISELVRALVPPQFGKALELMDRKLREWLATFAASQIQKLVYRDIIRFYRSAADSITIVGSGQGAAIARRLTNYVAKRGVPRLTVFDTPLFKVPLDILRSLIPSWRWIHCPSVEIHFLGSWDTVAQVQLPKSALGREFRPVELLADPRVPANVRHAVHLVALDESSDDLKPSLLGPPKPEPGSSISDARIEEIWFPGGHFNVTGGFSNDPIAESALAFMLKKFQESLEDFGVNASIDLKWDQLHGGSEGGVHISGDDEVVDESLRALTFGITGPVDQAGVRTLKDDAVLHESVIRMMAADSWPSYRPANVQELIGRLEARKEEAAKILRWLQSSGHISPEELESRTARLRERARIRFVS